MVRLLELDIQQVVCTLFIASSKKCLVGIQTREGVETIAKKHSSFVMEQVDNNNNNNSKHAGKTLAACLSAALLIAILAASGQVAQCATKPNGSSNATLGKPQPIILTKEQSVKVNFTDCGPRNIKEVRITPCPGDGTVCNINLGTNVTVEADFIAKIEASSLSEVIKGVVRGRELQFPEQRSDPCKSTISPSCPIKAGKFYQYKASFEIKPYYPAIPVKVRYALANTNGETVACVQIAAKIIDPSPVRSSRNKQHQKSKKPAA